MLSSVLRCTICRCRLYDVGVMCDRCFYFALRLPSLNRCASIGLAFSSHADTLCGDVLSIPLSQGIKTHKPPSSKPLKSLSLVYNSATMAAAQMTASRLLAPSTGISSQRRAPRPARALRVFASAQVRESMGNAPSSRRPRAYSGSLRTPDQPHGARTCQRALRARINAAV